MTRHEVRSQAGVGRHLRDRQGQREQRRLGHLRARELLDRSLQAELGNRQARGLGCILHVAREDTEIVLAQRPPHAHRLGSLPGEEERELAHGGRNIASG